MTDSREEPLNNSLTKSEPVEDTTAKDDGEIHSGVGVLDKTVKILDALESGPSTLGQLVAATGLARPTAHRLAIALERHRFVLRDQHGRFVLGSRFAELAAAAGEDRLLTAAGPILQTLLDRTGESAQIYRRQGDQRVCIAAVERTSGLRDSIPVGAMLSMEAGSAAQILLAWEDSDRLHQGLRHAKFTATKLAAVRKRGWSESVNEREEGDFRPDPQRLRPGHRRHLDFRPDRPHGCRPRTPLCAAGDGRRQVPHRGTGQSRSLKHTSQSNR